MPLSLSRVQELIRQEQQPTNRTAAAATRKTPASKPLSRDEFSQLLVRPLPPTLYKCPISEPTTTIVAYKWLPKQVQDKVDLGKARIFADNKSNHDDDEDDIIVEIPVAWMEQPSEGDNTNTALVAGSLAGQRRQGNLSDKLTEYTRGSRLQQPFRPGGLGPTVENNITEAQHDATSPEIIERNNKVLEMNEADLWRQGLLMTAPPGVSFKVGISLEDTTIPLLEPSADKNVAPRVEQEVHSAPTRPTRTASAPLFSKGYFDDDSLFGSSSDSEEEDFEEDGNEEESEQESDNVVTPSVDTVVTSAYSPQTEPLTSGATSEDVDIDGLLAELTLDPMKAKKSGTDLPANPLELAKRQARDQSNTTRKEWANTKYLPIKDFDALIPNPALVYPFTLDEFQQQAVARLERNEVGILYVNVVALTCVRLTRLFAVSFCRCAYICWEDRCGRVFRCIGHAPSYTLCLHLSN